MDAARFHSMTLQHRLALLLSCVGAGPLGAQDAYPRSVPGAPPAVYADPRGAADSLEALLLRDSLDYGANWRAAQALVTLASQAGRRGEGAVRDSLYEVAARYARRAVRLTPDGAEGHFVVALALGRASLTQPVRERIRNTREILAASRRAIELDSLHDGARHVLGRWHAEIRRLSGVERFIATRFLGAAVFNQASWEEAVRCLERAVALRPDWIYHRLDLALVYVDVERYADARAQLDAIAALEPRDVEDPEYQREAAEVAARIARKR